MSKTRFECIQVILKNWTQMTTGFETLTYSMNIVVCQRASVTFFFNTCIQVLKDQKSKKALEKSTQKTYSAQIVLKKVNLLKKVLKKIKSLKKVLKKSKIQYEFYSKKYLKITLKSFF